MRPTIKPSLDFDHQLEQYELELLLTDLTLAKRCGISEKQRQEWLSGKKPVPKPVYLALRSFKTTTLPEQFGPRHGFYLEREHLCCPFLNTKMHYSEFVRLDEYRRSHDLCLRQNDLIERIMIERDYYRAQCHREAKFGIMLNGIFWANL